MDAEIPKPAMNHKPQKNQTPQAKKTITPKLVFGILGAVLLALLLIWGIPRLSGESAILSECISIDECRGLANDQIGLDNPAAAVEALDVALRYAEGEEHPPHAELWCMRGDLLASLERYDEAIGSFENCMAWTQDDPGLEELRVFAQEQIDRINNR